MKKICIKCDIEKNKDEFHKKGKRLASWCKICTLKRSKEYYEKNKEKVKNNVLRSKRKRREIINDIKSQNPCKCGETHIACLDFHHLDPNTKLFEISRAISNYTSIKLILEEIKKCIIICKNCHAKLHYNENN